MEDNINIDDAVAITIETEAPTPSRFDECLTVVLHNEGGFVNHASDPGGMTNLGVTKATYESWVGRKVSERVMRKLKISDVTELYRDRYWKAVRADDLPVGLDLCVFDFGVNAGPSRAVKRLQQVVGALPDGILGPKTMNDINEYVELVGIEGIVRVYQSSRLEYYKSLRTFYIFGRGWKNRVEHVTEEALKAL